MDDGAPIRCQLATHALKGRKVRRRHDGLNAVVASDISLRPITFEDWSAVHEWASTEQACRYQPWGPNTPAETQAFAEDAVRAWHEEPLCLDRRGSSCGHRARRAQDP